MTWESKAIESLQTAIPYELGTPSEGGSVFLLGASNLYPAYLRGLAHLAAWRNAGWKRLPVAQLYGEYELVRLIDLIPSLVSRHS